MAQSNLQRRTDSSELQIWQTSNLTENDLHDFTLAYIKLMPLQADGISQGVVANDPPFFSGGMHGRRHDNQRRVGSPPVYDRNA